MWNSRKVGEWIEDKTAKKVVSKKQRGWEYLKKLENSPKVPRPHPHHHKANKPDQEAFKKASHEGCEAQGSLPDGEGRVMVRRRAPSLGLTSRSSARFGLRWERGRW
jgi:hypothetical protein